jgi:hypothetical protein
MFRPTGTDDSFHAGLRKMAATTCCHLLNAEATVGVEVTTSPNPLRSA